VLLVACSSASQRDAFTGSATTLTDSGSGTSDGPEDDDADSAVADPSDGESGPADDDDGPRFDVGAEPGSTTGMEPEECAKVDVLYVIDNSPSMGDEQQTLIANFPTFAADMQEALNGVESYQIGVITTDNYLDEGFLDDGANTVNAASPECQHLGGLVVQAHGGSCLPFADGNNFITDSDDLASKFTCIANVGEDGDSDEFVGDGLIKLLGSQQIANEVTDCNEGFIRDDALLVIVILTDENDSSDTGPSQWYDAVVAAKGVPENAVVLALVWDQSNPGCSAPYSETNGTQIVQFAQMFPNNSVGNICDASYDGFFSATLPLIESACDEFEPPG
jgi:hypothetical protein